ncbi:MAG: heme-binding domain-containing protein [Bacteroidetes bacterium]|nr:heme-binding domain-containing protein [Bacteroidota bacterium]
MLKKIIIGLLIVFVIIQFFRPARNNSGDTSMDMRKKYTVSSDVDQILERACNDCHSNNTRYPWYAQVQPVSWWLASHIKDGKRHLNFSNFLANRVAFQKHRMEDCIEQIDKGEMPLDSYLWIHKDAKLSDADKATLKGWCQGVIDSLKAQYPADSLVMPKRKRA